MTENRDLSADRYDRPPVKASAINTALMEAIRKGRYLPGSQLPNERKLAEAFGASRQQARDALLILNEMGLISRKVGSGAWLSEKAPQIIERIDADVDVRAETVTRSYLVAIAASSGTG